MRIGEARNETDLVAALETARIRRLDLRRGREVIWWNNIALVAGDHHASWNPDLARFEDRDPNFASTQVEGHKPRLVVNHALTVGRTELAKLTKSRPIMEIVANSDEQTDIAATKVGRAALDFAEWKFGLRKLRKNALWWMIQTGIGGLFVGWDPLDDQAGMVNYTIDPSTGEPTFNPDRERELEEMIERGELTAGDVKKESFPLGEVSNRVYSPFQLLPDELATEFDQLNDLIVEDVVDIDILKGLYSGRGVNNLRPDSNLAVGTMEHRILARSGVAGGAELAQAVNGTRVHTFWLKPNVYHGNSFLKNGIMLRWANGRVVLDFQKRYPFNDGRIPFVFFQHIPTSTTIWPDCVMNHIRGPNLEIDKTISQLIENKDYMANPMWLIATQHRVKGQIRNVAGAIVRYRHVPNIPPPQPVAGLQMPQQVENLLVGLRDQILDISGQSEVARGRVPSGVRSGVAVAYLQEEDDTKIGPTIENMEEAIALQGSLTLERFSQFYTFERVLRFYRRDGIFDVRKFKGADLKNNTDVICLTGSAMPRSKAARQQFAIEMATLFPQESDRRKLEQILELGEGEPDEVDKAIAQADRENNMMLHGVWKAQIDDSDEESRFQKLNAAVPVKAWHLHAIHKMRHMSVMMDEEFDQLAISHPEIVRLFDEHLAMHEQALVAEQQQQMMALMAAKGAPDGPPTPAGGSSPLEAMSANGDTAQAPDQMQSQG